jgi:hypothetical protein
MFRVVKGQAARKADNLTAICELIVYENVKALTSHNPMCLHGLLQGLALPYFFFKCQQILINVLNIEFHEIHSMVIKVLCKVRKRDMEALTGAICNFLL